MTTHEPTDIRIDREQRRSRGRRILVAAALLLGFVVWLVIYTRWQDAGDRADWSVCQSMYSRATTAADSVAVSGWQAGNEPRRPGHRLTCGQLRAVMVRRAT